MIIKLVEPFEDGIVWIVEAGDPTDCDKKKP